MGHIYIPTPQVSVLTHSFKDGKPTLEEIPVSIIPRGSEFHKREYFDDAMEADAEEIELHELVTLANEGDENAIVRYLGVHTTLYADTKQSRTIWLRKMEGVIRKLSASPLRGDALKSIFNMLCASLTSYAILPTQVTFELAKKLDAITISHLALKFGLFPSDCRIPLFLPKKDLGIGVRSFVTSFATSICRELQLNVQNLCGDILRARLAE